MNSSFTGRKNAGSQFYDDFFQFSSSRRSFLPSFNLSTLKNQEVRIDCED
jgi:hypothetical protein